MTTDPGAYAELIARESHRLYNRHAAALGWGTQESTRVAWFDLPAANRETMLATFRGLLDAGIITPGPALLDAIEETG